MSGVETRSRLEQLQALQRRTQHQIATAFRADDRQSLSRLQLLEARVNEAILAEGGPAMSPKAAGLPRSRRKKAEDRVGKHLERLGVSSHDVKTWAFQVGLVDAVRRGRIKAELVRAYEDAHPAAAQHVHRLTS